MLVLLKFRITLFICLLFVMKSVCFLNFTDRGDDVSRTEVKNFTLTPEVVKLQTMQWWNMTRFMRSIPAVLRRKAQQNRFMIQKTIYFLYYKNGILLFKTSPGINTEETISYVLDACGNEKTSFIFHGWTEGCSTGWVVRLMERLSVYRGGCIVCVDYSEWANRPYLDLMRRFKVISEVLYDEFLQLITAGLNPKMGYMFGFSYGGQLASKIGRLLQPEERFSQIDVCDLAGPGFDYITQSKHYEAADNVQCYHSSVDKGTKFRSCHQDILLGRCGYNQPAVYSQPYNSSHGLCVQMYINAFDYPFYAANIAPVWCFSANPVTNLPPGYTVGYKDSNGNLSRYVRGDIFVPTGMDYPYNLSKRQLMLYEETLRKNLNQIL